MKEIGGYFELETFKGRDYYPGLIKLNLGRTAAVHYLLETGRREVFLPHFLCASVADAVRNSGIRINRYRIKQDMTPDPADLPEGPLSDEQCLFLLNPYGLLTDAQIAEIRDIWRQVLCDFTHAFFQRPVPGTAALTSVRKFFGVTDGAYLASDRPISLPQRQDESHARFSHVLGRYERSAGEFYREMLDNAHSYEGALPLRMSPLTENILRGIDYEAAASARMRNFLRLDEMLGRYNELALSGVLRVPDVGPFVYPMLVKDGPAVRRKLAAGKIYVPTYWNNVITENPEDSIEYRFAADILALPCDHRYDGDDMERVAEAVLRHIGTK
ncbi:MAG: hypothetical protein Q4G47_03305 [Lachnospiraceae bacterium]|nr:hypothetical protein [Lachnospiraceae bacterium]